MQEKEFLSHEPAHNRLSSFCKIVAGAKRAAIYDLEKGNVYSVNNTASEIISGSPDKFDFWKKLTELGLTGSHEELIPQEVEITIPQVGLEFMWLELTAKCNQRCIHCYAESDSLKPTENMPLSKWERVIEEGKALGCYKLQFIGGEPLLFKGIFDLALQAKGSGYEYIEIFTNGTLLDENQIKKIKDLGIHVAVSLYSIVPEIHEAISLVPGSFQKTFRTLEMLKEAQIPTRIGIIVMRQNQDTVIETQRKLWDMGFDAGRADVVRPSGRGSCADLLPKDEIMQTWALMTKPNFSTSEHQFYRNHYWNSCWAGKVAITSGGGIIPCIFAREHVVSNIERGLEEAINSEGLQKLWKITKGQVEGCKMCEYCYACHDCRPLAEGATGNLFAKNPRCAYNPLTGKWEKGGEKI